MKRLSILLFAIILAINAIAQVQVKGYYRKDGNYVQPHVRSSPDKTPTNNYSYPGNVNPYTGKVATGSEEAYLKKYEKPNYGTVVPSYIPIANRTFLSHKDTGKKWGYSYTLQTTDKYTIKFIYDLESVKLFTVHEWNNGDVFVYNNSGYQLDYFNPKNK